MADNTNEHSTSQTGDNDATKGVEVRLAANDKEIQAAQRLRYKVFYEENGARANEKILDEQRDSDSYDDIADHLIVIDNKIKNDDDKIVGTYRLLRQDVAEENSGFYSSAEYNMEPLLASDAHALELGRSCVLAEYRTRPVIQLLWSGISQYIKQHDIGALFGCASIPGTDIDAISKQLAYLYHYHLAPENICPVAVENRHIEMNLHDKQSLNQRAVFSSLPPLFKGYLRIGCFVGNGAVIDHDFNTTDVCMILPMRLLAERYKKHYDRRNEKAPPLSKEKQAALQNTNQQSK